MSILFRYETLPIQVKEQIRCIKDQFILKRYPIKEIPLKSPSLESKSNLLYTCHNPDGADGYNFFVTTKIRVSDHVRLRLEGVKRIGHKSKRG